MDELLRMEHVSKRFGDFYANRDINLSVRKGEVHTLLGENGAGKSTLMNVLIGLYQPTEGKIFLNGKEVRIDSPAQAVKLGIGMVHQHFMLVPSLTVAENIGFDDADSVHPENFSLENWFLGKEYGGQELSGGQWQRVALYRCLHKDAEFYVLDEPTAYLDPSHEAEAVAEILEQLKDKTVLIITHRSGICRLMDQVIVMDKNHKIAGTGSHEELSQTCPVYQKLYESQAEWYR